LFGKQAEVLRDEACRPGSDAIERLAGEQEIAEQDTQDRGGGQVGPTARQRRQVTLEQARQVEAFQEAAEQRCSADLKRFMA
jgi:hypothetical protein